MMKTDKAEDLLVEEFKEAWSHYRHVESTRVQYLGFFFTVVFGISGFVIAVLKDLQPSSTSCLPSRLVLGLFTLGWLLFMLTILLFASVRKLGLVLRHYEGVIKQVRNMLYPSDWHIDTVLNIRESQHPVMKMGILVFSTQLNMFSLAHA